VEKVGVNIKVGEIVTGTLGVIVASGAEQATRKIEILSRSVFFIAKANAITLSEKNFGVAAQRLALPASGRVEITRFCRSQPQAKKKP
jgi:hypothetical protein